MTRSCTECQHYQGRREGVGPCTLRELLVVSYFDAPRCSAYSPISGDSAGAPARSVSEDGRTAADAANSSFFEAVSEPLETHQRRCSTADESGVPENAC